MPQTMNDDIKVLKAAKDAAVKLTTAERDLRERHGALNEERRRVFHALRSRPDVLANVDRLVDAAHERFWFDRGPGWLTALSGHREIVVEGLGTDRERERVRTVAPTLPDVHGLVNAPGALRVEDLCGLIPDALKANLRAVINAMPEAQFGLPDEARPAKLAELDAAIAEVEARHAELVDGAAEVGLQLALLPAVAERRKAEALRDARERARGVERAVATS
jgi:hypothetical protein